MFHLPDACSVILAEGRGGDIDPATAATLASSMLAAYLLIRMALRRGLPRGTQGAGTASPPGLGRVCAWSVAVAKVIALVLSDCAPVLRYRVVA